MFSARFSNSLIAHVWSHQHNYRQLFMTCCMEWRMRVMTCVRCDFLIGWWSFCSHTKSKCNAKRFNCSKSKYSRKFKASTTVKCDDMEKGNPNLQKTTVGCHQRLFSVLCEIFTLPTAAETLVMWAQHWSWSQTISLPISATCSSPKIANLQCLLLDKKTKINCILNTREKESAGNF